MKAFNWDFETAPTFVASTCPALKSIRVGIPRMPNLGGVFEFSSIFILVTLSLSLYSVAISSRMEGNTN